MIIIFILLLPLLKVYRVVSVALGTVAKLIQEVTHEADSWIRSNILIFIINFQSNNRCSALIYKLVVNIKILLFYTKLMGFDAWDTFWSFSSYWTNI